MEVTAALRRRVRLGQTDSDTAVRVLDDLADLAATRWDHEPLARRIWDLRENVTASDACYVVLAELLDAELVTSDVRLARAPGLRCTKPQTGPVTWLSVVWTRAETSGAADRLLVAEVATRTGRHVRVTRLCPHCGSSEHGRPVLVADRPGSAVPAVSLSRGGGLTVVAVADTAGLGVDVEAVAAVADGSVARVLGEPVDDAAALATTWVRTEAALKAAGTGLAVDPATIRLSDPDRPPAVVEWPPGVVRPGWLLDLDLGPGRRAAAAGTGVAPDDVSVRQVGPAAARG